jgi:Na+-translocating ferredoxin:NAD+ oxidoreductase RnfC subunit
MQLFRTPQDTKEIVMSRNSTPESYGSLQHGVHDFATVDVGEISDAYPNPADRQAIHDAYERGNAVAAEKHEPQFDNRFGFAGTMLKH